jgi:hypothetical protein
MIVLFSQVVLGAPRDFTLENDSSSYIIHRYVSPTSSESWRDDILDVDALPLKEDREICCYRSRRQWCETVMHDQFLTGRQ